MTALLLVDIQNDFLPGGALPVPRGNEVIGVANRLIRALPASAIVATQDWHPPGHGSFASAHAGKRPFDVGELGGLDQVLWPDHCVQHSYGAALAAGLHSHRIEHIIFKGTDPGIDSYSALFDNAQRKSTGLHRWLSRRGESQLVVMGLATDYCVRCTVLDARRLGFDTTVVVDGCRGVNQDSGDSDRAFEEMKRAGARLVESGELAAV